MKSGVIDFYYFTGTGNTLLVARRMADVFINNGIETNLKRIEKNSPGKINLDHAIGLAFPITCQTASPFIWNFVNSLPETSGTEVFMVDTMMMYSGAIVGPLRRVLQKKSYNTVGAKEILMPNNWYPKKVDREKNRAKSEKGLDKAADYAREIVSGKSRWIRVPVLSDGFYRMMRSNMVWDLMARTGESFQVDRNKCSECGICEDICPVGNIRIDEAYPFLSSCIQCLRCISFCPKDAISRPGKKYERYRAVNVKEIIGT